MLGLHIRVIASSHYGCNFCFCVWMMITSTPRSKYDAANKTAIVVSCLVLLLVYRCKIRIQVQEFALVARAGQAELVCMHAICLLPHKGRRAAPRHCHPASPSTRRSVALQCRCPIVPLLRLLFGRLDVRILTHHPTLPPSIPLPSSVFRLPSSLKPRATPQLPEFKQPPVPHSSSVRCPA